MKGRQIMNYKKRIISMLLCVIMLASISVSSFAITPPCDAEYPQFDSMFTIGDSNAMGYGLDGYYGNPHYSTEGNNVNDYTDFSYLNGTYGAFPQLVQEALGIDRAKHNAMTYPAERAKDALYYLGGDVDMSTDKFFPITMSEWMPVYLLDSNDDYDTETVWHQWREWKLDKSADKGESPVIGIPKGDVFINQLKAQPDDNKLVLMYSGIADIFFSSVQLTLNDPEVDGDDLVAMIAALAKYMWNNYYEALQSVPALIEQVKKLNPDCTLVLIGSFNPIKDLKLSDDGWLPIFDAMSAITSLFNQHNKQWAEEYDALYVDITNVETRTLSEGYSFDMLFSDNPEPIYHATPEGHEYIARQILKALELDKTSTTDIVVDLGSVKDVSSVVVGGQIVSGYTFDKETHTLTVPCDSTTERVMTVTEKREDGSVYLAMYQLSYGEDGYTAYRMYATRNVTETFTNIIRSIWSVCKSIIDSLFGLFR